MLEVRPVRSPRERRAFLNFPWRVYRGDPLWVPPLLRQRARTTDPRRGPFFQRGEADFFVAWRGGRPVGTICAANDPYGNRQRHARDCLIGFFDYLEDDEAVAGLLEAAGAWGRSRGCEALFGPFNLDYEDGYGVLVEGWDRPPALMCGHSPPYYREAMARFGFAPARAENLAFAIDLDRPDLERLSRVADAVRRRGRIRVRQADFGRWDEEVETVLALLNQALAHLPGHLDWRPEMLAGLLGQVRRIAVPELILFAEAGGRTVGFLPGLPNVNEILIHAGGLRRPWDYLRLLRHLGRRPRSLCVKSVLVLPEYRKGGAGPLLFDELARRARARGYVWADLSITSADNPDTVALAERLGATVYKRWQVYRRPL